MAFQQSEQDQCLRPWARDRDANQESRRGGERRRTRATTCQLAERARNLSFSFTFTFPRGCSVGSCRPACQIVQASSARHLENLEWEVTLPRLGLCLCMLPSPIDIANWTGGTFHAACLNVKFPFSRAHLKRSHSNFFPSELGWKYSFIYLYPESITHVLEFSKSDHFMLNIIYTKKSTSFFYDNNKWALLKHHELRIGFGPYTPVGWLSLTEKIVQKRTQLMPLNIGFACLC